MSEIELKDPARKTSVRGPYLRMQFPKCFRIDTLKSNGTWTERGPFNSDRVEERDDGSYVLTSDHSGHFIQCIADHGDFFVHVSAGGAGVIRYCRIVALSDRIPLV